MNYGKYNAQSVRKYYGMSIDKKIKIEHHYYTIQCICDLYDVVKKETLSAICEAEELKQNRVIFSLLHKVILKFKTKLLNSNTNEQLEFNLEYYQAYHLIAFLLENNTRFTGLAEQNALQQLAWKIDSKLST